jgi:hypothetical protein
MECPKEKVIPFSSNALSKEPGLPTPPSRAVFTPKTTLQVL